MFGQMIVNAAQEDPKKAAKLLSMGFTISELMSFPPSRTVSPSRRYGLIEVSKSLKVAFDHPERSAMVSIFIPCEPLAAAGITPLSVEAFSGVAGGTCCEQYFLEKSKEDGEPETLCSFHRIFHGAMSCGVLPAPKMLIYTNLACDANMISFPYVVERYNIPSFFIEVPYERNMASVKYVAGQIKDMVKFIEDTTGKEVSQEKLLEATARGKRTAKYYLEGLNYVKDHALKGPTEGEMYGVYAGHIMMGSRAGEEYCRRMLEDLKRTPGNDAVRVVWMHMMPFLQPSVNSFMGFSTKLRVTANDLVYDSMFDVDIEDPYEAMAYRMVYSVYNGEPSYRGKRALEMAKKTGAEGIIIFAHWGCKATFGAAASWAKMFEREGFPTLVLNGDGGDPANNADGQMSTRLGAFVEMVENNRK